MKKRLLDHGVEASFRLHANACGGHTGSRKSVTLQAAGFTVVMAVQKWCNYLTNAPRTSKPYSAIAVAITAYAVLRTWKAIKVVNMPRGEVRSSSMQKAIFDHVLPYQGIDQCENASFA